MNRKRDKPDSLRTEAEARLAQSPSTKPSKLSPEKVLHELRVHQIELEMQNETLRHSQLALEESRDRYADLFEFAPACYLTLCKNALISEINLTGCALLGVERAKLLNRRLSKYIAPHDMDRWHRLLTHMMTRADFDKQAFDLEMIRGDGTAMHVHFNCMRREIVDAQPVLRIALTDISELKLAEAKLRIAAIVFESQEGMVVTDANSLIVNVNRSFTRITGYPAEEVIGRNPKLLSSGRHDAAFYTALWGSIARLGYWEGEIWNKRKNGEIYPEHLIITAVKDQYGKVTNYVGTLTDITMSRNAADEIQHLAFYDPLTRLPASPTGDS